MTADELPARGLAAKVGEIEAELARLDSEIAPRVERRDMLARSLEAIRRALDPKQIGLPLPGVGKPLPKLREPSAMAEVLLRRAASNPGGVLIVARTGANRGEIKSAASLATGPRPLLVEAERIKGQVTYRLTPDGEAVARALSAEASA